MLTNTYLPHVGGVARSVAAFSNSLRAKGHRVHIIAPSFEGQPEHEVDVTRVPAIQHFNGSDFSVRLPIPVELSVTVEDFKPDVVHSHHSFLMGDTALRIAALYEVPLVFTHHTMYERYTHYVPGDSLALKRYVIDLTTSYANMCAAVIAPSESIREILQRRKVTAPITVIPTGVDTGLFESGDGETFRTSLGIPPDSFVVGHLGRLAEEKNLGFLCEAVSLFLSRHEDARFLIVGSGTYENQIRSFFGEKGLSQRLHLAGPRRGQELVNAYHAMDVFVFASQTETQGMVITEAMAAGVPVIAVDAPGVREVIVHGDNSYLLESEDRDAFAARLTAFKNLPGSEQSALSQAARKRAAEFSIEQSSAALLNLYSRVCEENLRHRQQSQSAWSAAMRLIEKELTLWSNRAHAAGAAFDTSGDSGANTQTGKR